MCGWSSSVIILRLLGWYEDGDFLGMVMDFCAGGEVVDAVRAARLADESMTEAWAAEVFRQLFDALCYCHGQGIVHKDLKTDNILLLTAPTTGRPFFACAPHAVLADWGLSEQVGGGLLFARRGREVAGTGYTMAPEVWRGSCGPKCDIWSLGCVLFQLLANRMPFDPPDGALEGLNKKTKGNVWLDLHKRGPDWRSFTGQAEVRSLCQQMLAYKEAERPDAKRCRRHAWVETSTSAMWGGTAVGEEVEAACRAVATWPQRHPWQRALFLRLAASRASINQVASVFARLDRDHNGVLSRAELVEGLEAHGASRAGAKLVPATLDMDGAGVCSFVELVAASLPAWPEALDELLCGKYASLLAAKRSKLAKADLHELWEDLAKILPEPCDSVPSFKPEEDGLISIDGFRAFFGGNVVGYSGPAEPWGSIKKRKSRGPKPGRLKKQPLEAVTQSFGRQLAPAAEPSEESSSSGCNSGGSWCSYSSGEEDGFECSSSAPKPQNLEASMCSMDSMGRDTVGVGRSSVRLADRPAAGLPQRAQARQRLGPAENFASANASPACTNACLDPHAAAASDAEGAGLVQQRRVSDASAIDPHGAGSDAEDAAFGHRSSSRGYRAVELCKTCPPLASQDSPRAGSPQPPPPLRQASFLLPPLPAEKWCSLEGMEAKLVCEVHDPASCYEVRSHDFSPCLHTSSGEAMTTVVSL